MKLMPGKNEKVQSSMFKILWHYVWEFADLIGMWGVTSKGYWTNEWRLCHFQWSHLIYYNITVAAESGVLYIQALFPVT